MNLTPEQEKTIEYFGLEVVERDRYYKGDAICTPTGGILMVGCEGYINDYAVVRPRHAARIAELEAKVAALESELAPVRALKVGSAEWAMVQTLLGHDVRDSNGRRRAISYTVSDGEPFTLHVEPEPTAAELADAIQKYERTSDGDDYKRMIALAARVKRKEPTP